jgi:tetratricopeptide (TPR) repeat protein
MSERTAERIAEAPSLRCTLVGGALLAVATLAAYANAWPNRLVHDDHYLARSEAGWDLTHVGRFFTEDLWASLGLETGFYRPLFQLSVWADHRLYGDWLAGLHLTTIVIHLLVTWAVFAFLRQWLRAAGPSAFSAPVRADHAALLGALVFAVHPVHTEVVNSVYNRSESLATLAGVLGLWWLMRHVAASPVRAWLGLALAWLLALFAKESAIVLPGIAVCLVVLATPRDWRVLWSRSWPAACMLIPLAIYFAQRSMAMSDPGTDTASVAGLPVEGLPGHTVWLRASGLWAEGLRALLWPPPFRLYHETPSDPVQWASIVLHGGLIAMAIHRYWRGDSGWLAGLAIYYLALLPVSRLFFSQGEYPTLAERYLYFASVCLSVWIASAIYRSSLKPGQAALLAIGALVLAICLPWCWQRNADWSSDLRLYEANYRNGDRGANSVRLLAGSLLVENRTEQAAALCDLHADMLPADGRLSNNCAVAFNRVGRADDAIRAFQHATSDAAVVTEAHLNLGQIYLRRGDAATAREQFEMAVASESDPALRAYMRGLVLVLMYRNDPDKVKQARQHLVEALRLQPNLVPARQLLQQIDAALERVR